ncbi:MAG: hypothetical protein AAFN00_19645, partial [Cyanobacteria bacterium J06558_2]
LDSMATETAEQSYAVNIFVRLLKQVWQIDWTVAAYDVLGHFFSFDIPYFYRFMQMDEGEEEEKQLLIDWVNSRYALKAEDKQDLLIAIDKVNQLRMQARSA